MRRYTKLTKTAIILVMIDGKTRNLSNITKLVTAMLGYPLASPTIYDHLARLIKMGNISRIRTGYYRLASTSTLPFWLKGIKRIG